MVILRWQVLPPGADPEGAIRGVRVAKLADLASVVPDGQARMDSATRKTQQAERARHYRVRLQR